MEYVELIEVVDNAKIMVRDGDFVIRRTALLLVGRMELANVDSATLCALKRELADFNMQTKTWKGE